MFCLGKCISGSKASRPLEDELQVALNRLLLRAEGSTPVEISKKILIYGLFLRTGLVRKAPRSEVSWLALQDVSL